MKENNAVVNACKDENGKYVSGKTASDFKIGDKVVCLDTYGPGGFKMGMTATVVEPDYSYTSIDVYDFLWIKADETPSGNKPRDGGYYPWMFDKVVTIDDIEVGDTVRRVKEFSNYTSTTKGSEYVVVKIENDSAYADDGHSTLPENLVLVKKADKQASKVDETSKTSLDSSEDVEAVVARLVGLGYEVKAPKKKVKKEVKVWVPSTLEDIFQKRLNPNVWTVDPNNSLYVPAVISYEIEID